MIRRMSAAQWVGLGAALLLASLPLTGDRYVLFLGSQILISCLFALSFNLMLGYGGMISFGHAAYFAIGAYACAIFLTTLELPLLVAFPGAVALTALLAAVIGYFCVRLSDVYFAMLTLAFGQLVWAVAFKWSAVTGGDTGFIGVRTPAFLHDVTAFYYFVLAVVGVCGALIWIIVHSAFGHILVATRENRVRAEFVGVNVRRVQLVTFVLAGGFAGVAGALFTLFNRAVFVELAWWSASAEVLIMTVLGGVGSFFGPVIGAAALILLNRGITEFTEYWPAVLALILLAVLFLLPDGLVGIGRRLRRRGKD